MVAETNSETTSHSSIPNPQLTISHNISGSSIKKTNVNTDRKLTLEIVNCRTNSNKGGDLLPQKSPKEGKLSYPVGQNQSLPQTAEKITVPTNETSSTLNQIINSIQIDSNKRRARRMLPNPITGPAMYNGKDPNRNNSPPSDTEDQGGSDDISVVYDDPFGRMEKKRMMQAIEDLNLKKQKTLSTDHHDNTSNSNSLANSNSIGDERKSNIVSEWDLGPKQPHKVASAPIFQDSKSKSLSEHALERAKTDPILENPIRMNSFSSGKFQKSKLKGSENISKNEDKFESIVQIEKINPLTDSLQKLPSVQMNETKTRCFLLSGFIPDIKSKIACNILFLISLFFFIFLFSPPPNTCRFNAVE